MQLFDAFIQQTALLTVLIDGGATSSYYYGPLKPETPLALKQNTLQGFYYTVKYI